MVSLRDSFIWSLALIAAPFAALAEQIHEPLRVENLSPLVQLIGLPAQRSADINAGVSVSWHADIATHFIARESENERVFFDGETQQHTLDLRWGLATNWEVSAQLPFIQHSGGFLDSYVNGWHDFFGMTDGGRSQFPEDRIRYQYNGIAGQSLLDGSASGLGDITVELARISERQPDLQIAYAVGFKGSSGSSSDWTGSGASDVYGLARFSGAHLGDLPLYWHGQLGVTRVGDSDLLSAQQKNLIYFAGLSAEWLMSEQWAVIVQFDSHSAPMDSELESLGSTAGLLSLGVRHQLSQDWAVDISFAEDILVETGPDIVFKASFHYRP